MRLLWLQVIVVSRERQFVFSLILRRYDILVVVRISEMESIEPQDIKKGLATRIIGSRIECYKSLPSTMDKARQRAGKGVIEGAVIIAEEQTKARGRLKRSWISPKGNIAFSVILYPQTEFLPYLIMIASGAVFWAIRDITGLKAEIKWPNDILVNGRKVCGILIESGTSKQRQRYAVIGIGLNVSFKNKSYPEIDKVATNLESELGNGISRTELLKKLITRLDEFYSLLEDGESIYKQWRDEIKMLGKRVQVTCGEETIEGIARDVSRDGSLILQCRDGHTKKILAGDVSLCEL